MTKWKHYSHWSHLSLRTFSWSHTETKTPRSASHYCWDQLQKTIYSWDQQQRNIMAPLCQRLLPQIRATEQPGVCPSIPWCRSLSSDWELEVVSPSAAATHTHTVSLSSSSTHTHTQWGPVTGGSQRALRELVQWCVCTCEFWKSVTEGCLRDRSGGFEKFNIHVFKCWKWRPLDFCYVSPLI